ncbi:hypothetical protein MMC31_005435, partial [Peltigera leucophlebia]|nr:hypothetical protein [Peltigera leucophlebia]
MTFNSLYEFPSDVKAKRELLFNPCDHLTLSREQWDLYWPYIDNAWSRSASETNAKGHRVEYYRCRQWRKETHPLPSSGEDESVQMQKRQKVVRHALGCGMKILCTHIGDGEVIITRGKKCPGGHIDSLEDADRAKLPSAFVKVAAAEVKKGHKVATVAHVVSGADDPEQRAAVADAGGRWLSRQDVHNAVAKYKKPSIAAASGRRRTRLEESQRFRASTSPSPTIINNNNIIINTKNTISFPPPLPPSFSTQAPPTPTITTTAAPTTTTIVSLPILAKMIDYSILDPCLTDNEISMALALCAKYNVATACITPPSMSEARLGLSHTTVKICTVIGFPHGTSTTASKLFEANEAIQFGAHEIEMVINISKARSHEWTYITDEIRQVNSLLLNHHHHNQQQHQQHAPTSTPTPKPIPLKVIFETDLLNPLQITQLCHICSSLKIAYAVTSTGFGYVKRVNGMYTTQGATKSILTLMRQTLLPSTTSTSNSTAAAAAESNSNNVINVNKVELKASGNVISLDDLIRAKAEGASRVGT